MNRPKSEGVYRVLFIIACAALAALVMHVPVCDEEPAQCVTRFLP